MALELPKVQTRLFEDNGRGPVLNEGVVPPFNPDDVTIALEGRYWSASPGATRPDMVVNKQYTDAQIAAEISSLPEIEYSDDTPPAFFRQTTVLDQDYPADAQHETPWFERGTPSLLVFKNGKLTNRGTSNVDYQFYFELPATDPTNKFSNGIQARHGTQAGDVLVFWIA
jgi:hypothetical protein